ncbi:MAG: TolC family protein [Desulfobulbaceae bacterium]|nr:TolC family protein [Desulfobulbaceae bacterium]
MTVHTFFTPLLLALNFIYFSTSAIAAESEVDSRNSEPWTVQRSVSFALTNSPDIKIAQQKILLARANKNQAESSLYPWLSVGARYAQTDTPMYSFGNILNQGEFDNTIDFNDPGRSDNLGLTADLRYRLYSGGRDRAGINAAAAHENAADQQLEALHNGLAFGVVHGFYSIMQAEEIVQANKSAIEAIEASLNAAKARFEAGTLLKVDLLDLELQKSLANENLIQASHNLDLVKQGFINLLGLESTDISIAPDDTTKPAIPAELHPDHRPELKSLDAMIESTRAGVEQARSANYPSINAFGTYQYDKGFEYEGSGNSWTAGVSLNQNIFDGYQTSAAIAAAEAQLADALEQKRKMLLAIKLEIEKASLGIKQAEQRLSVTETMVSQATERARLSRERFKEGVILTSDLIDVENRLTDATVRRTVAKAARRIAIADLRRAVGLEQF